MGFLDKIISFTGPRARLLEELAEIAGSKEVLAERLQRHSARCAIPRVREELERLAAEEARHVNILKRILSDNRLWPRRPELPPHDGSNNWERISSDLELLSQTSLALDRQSLKWMGVDEAIGAEISRLGDENEHRVARLREAAAKLDPQAID